MFHGFEPLPRARRFRARATLWTSISALAVLGVLLSLVGGATAAATAVPLGTAGAFAVLAGSGITNSGATTISGDTGSSPTSVESGFAACPGPANCVTQTGTNHTAFDPNDAATQSAKLALTNAYDVAAGQTPTTIPSELAGQILTPGVYNSTDGTFGMTGTLTLDGAGDPNATFIFQTANGTGTLITGGTGNVVLTGSAQSCNLFWKVGSSATLAGGSTFRGNILANVSISLGAAVTVDGSLLAGEQASGTGAVTLINDTITRATCAATSSSPPATTAAATTAVTTATTATTTGTSTGPTPAETAAQARARALRVRAAASKAATAAKANAARARAAARAAAAQKAASRRRAATSRHALTTGHGSARPPLGHVGLTG